MLGNKKSKEALAYEQRGITYCGKMEKDKHLDIFFDDTIVRIDPLSRRTMLVKVKIGYSFLFLFLKKKIVTKYDQWDL